MLNPETTELSTRIAVFAKPADIQLLARVLAEELAMHPTDAMHEARSARNLLSPRLTSANEPPYAGR